MPPATLPTALPPPSFHPQVLPILLRRLRNTPQSSLEALLPTLSLAARILSSDRAHGGHLSLSTSLPLSTALSISSSGTSLPLPLLLDLTLAYPSCPHPISDLWTQAFDHPQQDDQDLSEIISTQFLPPLISHLQLLPSIGDISSAAQILLTLSRAHEELLAVLLSEADYILPCLRGVYGRISKGKEGTKVKGDIVLFCAELLGAVQGESVKEGLKRLIGGSEDRQGRVGVGFLEGDSLGEDLEFWIGGRKGKVGEEVKGWLVDIRDDEARGDPRVQAILNLFPTLPPHQLLLALNHPTYATSSTSSAEEQASPLLDVILSGGSDLPPELNPLKKAIRAMSEQQDAISSASLPTPAISGSVTPAPAQAANGTSKPYVRANIFDNTSLDISRLTIKSEVDEPQPLTLAPGVGKEVSDEMRASILRLVERQRIEAEEEARAVAEARGEKYRPERTELDGDELDDGDEVGVRHKIGGRRGSEDDESGEEENGENVIESRNKDSSKPQVHSYDVSIQTKLELAYLADPRVFDKDGITRRSGGRAKLKQATGMDDSQLEGWRIMLDRNPHKEAILARHTFVPGNNLDYVMNGNTSSNGSTSGSNRGGSRGRGGGGGGRGGGGGSSRGGGGSQNGRGGGSNHGGRGGVGGGGNGQGGGGARGRGANKGNRGHSNAARTRGHDKKMSRMGQGI